MKAKVLILCTGNSCRSQMAEGLLKSFDDKLEVFSGGTNPAGNVSPDAIRVMKEIGIDISCGRPKNADIFVEWDFDYVITVCDNAMETCPLFTGKAHKRIHIGFPDPGNTSGTDEEILEAHRKVRDDMKRQFEDFYNSNLKNKKYDKD